MQSPWVQHGAHGGPQVGGPARLGVQRGAELRAADRLQLVELERQQHAQGEMRHQVPVAVPVVALQAHAAVLVLQGLVGLVLDVPPRASQLGDPRRGRAVDREIRDELPGRLLGLARRRLGGRHHVHAHRVGPSRQRQVPAVAHPAPGRPPVLGRVLHLAPAVGPELPEEPLVVALLDPDHEVQAMLPQQADHGLVGVQRVQQHDPPEMRVLGAEARQVALRGVALAVVLGLAVRARNELRLARQQHPVVVRMHHGPQHHLVEVLDAVLVAPNAAGGARLPARRVDARAVDGDQAAALVDVERPLHDLGALRDREQPLEDPSHRGRVHLVQPLPHRLVRRRLAHPVQRPQVVRHGATRAARPGLELEQRPTLEREHRQRRHLHVADRMAHRTGARDPLVHSRKHRIDLMVEQRPHG